MLLGILEADPRLIAARSRQTVIADRQYYGQQFEATLNDHSITLLRPTQTDEPARPGAALFKPLRQVIESINDTFKGQLDLEHHGGHTPLGGLGPRPATRSGPHCRHLAQRPHRRTHTKIIDRLRPLTLESVI